jgi:hypothetical protein
MKRCEPKFYEKILSHLYLVAVSDFGLICFTRSHNTAFNFILYNNSALYFKVDLIPFRNNYAKTS